MTPKTKKIVKIGAILLIVGLLIGLSTAYYMFNKPHRDTQSAKTDFTVTSTQIVQEYLENNAAANEKYLSDDGDSKILEITGTVNNISEDFNGLVVILLKSENDKAGVSCSFTEETNDRAKTLRIGQTVTIKGVIRSGAAYDEDLEMYENVIVEKSNVLNVK
ncbi:MAG: OB-fold putative lipoprotein [Lentimicrobium sp.]|nr:OB-fold putative lipoprotein [Lentimicrobium sp.]